MIHITLRFLLRTGNDSIVLVVVECIFSSNDEACTMIGLHCHVMWFEIVDASFSHVSHSVKCVYMRWLCEHLRVHHPDRSGMRNKKKEKKMIVLFVEICNMVRRGDRSPHTHTRLHKRKKIKILMNVYIAVVLRGIIRIIIIIRGNVCWLCITQNCTVDAETKEMELWEICLCTLFFPTSLCSIAIQRIRNRCQELRSHT